MSFQSALELPKDLEKGLLLLTAFGQKEVHIENHGGITGFSSDRIDIRYKNGSLVLIGMDLKIEHYDSDELEINGFIQEISFVK